MITITIRLDDHAEAYRLAAEATTRYGADAVEALHDDDQESTADDIDLLTRAVAIVHEARSEDEAIAALRALQRAHSDSNGVMRYLDEAIARVGADEAPPRGIPRPQLPPRPNATRKGNRDTPQRAEALAYVRDQVVCPTCKAPVGQFCRGPGWGPNNPQTYGHQHMHEARIDAVYGPRYG